MHKLSVSAAILEHELSELRLLLERHAGVLLDTPSAPLAERITEYLESRHLSSAGDLVARLRSCDAECEALLERLLDGETGFFRCPDALEGLAKVVLPEIETRKFRENPRSLRIWSAGCSTGEEAYSIAISVCEAVTCQGGGWNIHIVASDIRREALHTAKRGLYPQQALAHVRRQLIETYFSKLGQHLLVKPRLRKLVTFSPMNLARPAYIGRFDCIFCMDVLPSFSLAQRMALAQRLHLYLEPGGYLLLGQDESLPAVSLPFHSHTHAGFTLFQKPVAAAAKSGTF